MNDTEFGLANRTARLEERVRVLSVLLGITAILAIASGALAAWHAYDAREARKHEGFSKRKIEYLESRLGAHAAGADRQLATLERELAKTRLRVRYGELTAFRRWLARADRAMAENRTLIEDLGSRLAVLEDSLGMSQNGGE